MLINVFTTGNVWTSYDAFKVQFLCNFYELKEQW